MSDVVMSEDVKVVRGEGVPCRVEDDSSINLSMKYRYKVCPFII